MLAFNRYRLYWHGVFVERIPEQTGPVQQENVKHFIYLILILWPYAALAQPAAPVSSIVAHPSVAVSALSRAQLRSIFLMRQVVWPDGTAIKVFVLPPESTGHQQFCREQLQLFPYQLERVWQKLIYSGTGTAPSTLPDRTAMLEMIARTPGAIGYTESEEGTQVVKVIALTH